VWQRRKQEKSIALSNKLRQHPKSLPTQIVSIPEAVCSLLHLITTAKPGEIRATTEVLKDRRNKYIAIEIIEFR